jgi:hypothetical protein
MNHLTMEQLLQLRGAPSDPGAGDARAHLDSCEVCRLELDRLHQRVARLKALPSLRPARDAWPTVRNRLVAEKQKRQTRWMGIAGLAMAASVILAVIVADVSDVGVAQAATSELIDSAMAQSQELEGIILEIDPDSRVIDGRMARITAELEDRIAALDRELQQVQLAEGQRMTHEQQLLRLWRQRVGLLDALVDIHVTRASNVGL